MSRSNEKNNLDDKIHCRHSHSLTAASDLLDLFVGSIISVHKDEQHGAVGEGWKSFGNCSMRPQIWISPRRHSRKKSSAATTLCVCVYALRSMNYSSLSAIPFFFYL